MAGDGGDDGLVLLPHDHNKVGQSLQRLLVLRVLLRLEVVQVCQEMGACGKDNQPLHPESACVLSESRYTVKKANYFPIPSRDVTNQNLPGQEQFNFSQPGRVWLVTSRLGTRKSLTFFLQCNWQSYDPDPDTDGFGWVRIQMDPCQSGRIPRSEQFFYSWPSLDLAPDPERRRDLDPFSDSFQIHNTSDR
jgi:hypothetical protein